MKKTRLALALFTLAAAASFVGCRRDASSASSVKPRQWQILASELPSALLSVSGRSASDIFAVGADKGHGPLVLHFDGKAWKELSTGATGDLWWVFAPPSGPVLMAGANANVLR